MVGFGATAGNAVPAPGIERRSLVDANGALAGAGVGASFCAEGFGGGAFGASAAGTFGEVEVTAGLGTVGRVTPGTGIFFTSGRWATGAERVEGGAPAADGALLAAGAGGVPTAGAGMDSNSSGILSSGGTAVDADTSLTGGGGSLPGSASPSPGTLETWIT